jgi:hypothetical protein
MQHVPVIDGGVLVLVDADGLQAAYLAGMSATFPLAIFRPNSVGDRKAAPAQPKISHGIADRRAAIVLPELTNADEHRERR